MLYEAAVQAAIAANIPRLVISALGHYAREEMQFGVDGARRILQRGQKYRQSLSPWESELMALIFKSDPVLLALWAQ
ncbi:hypothetical protein D3C83_158650 [compost metagenome]